MKYIITIEEDLTTEDRKYDTPEIYKQVIESDSSIVTDIMEVILKNQSHIQYPPIKISSSFAPKVEKIERLSYER